jgi:hypothetical protein
MKHTIEHDLNDAEARVAVQRAFAEYRQAYAEYQPFLIWGDDAHANLGFSVKGIKLSGRIELQPHEVDVELDVPLPLRLFKGKAIAAIDKEVRRFIEIAHRERDPQAQSSVAGERGKSN